MRKTLPIILIGTLALMMLAIILFRSKFEWKNADQNAGETANVLTPEESIEIAIHNDMNLDKLLFSLNILRNSIIQQNAIMETLKQTLALETSNAIPDLVPENTATLKSQNLQDSRDVQILASPEHINYYHSNDDMVWEFLKAKLMADGLDKDKLDTMFVKLNGQYSQAFMAQKVIELYGWRYKKKAGFNMPDDEAKTFSPPNYQALAGSMSTASCHNFMKRNEKLLAGVYKRYGVPPSVVTSILLVETGIGANMGQQSAFRVLASMAASDTLAAVEPIITNIILTPEQRKDIEKIIFEKSVWARNELVALIEYASENNIEIETIPGSVYGAIGLCQFMPSNIKAYGVDGDGDKSINIFKLPDAAYSVGRYLSAHGWKNAVTPGAQLSVIRSYNHSDIYAATVYGVAMQLISPTTHASVQSAQQGGNAVSAVRRTVNSHMGTGNGKQIPGATITKLPSYDELLKK